MKQEYSATIRKVKFATAGAGVAGAVVVILVWLASLYSVEIPTEVQSALTILLPALVAWASGYLSNPAPTDNIIEK